MGTCPSSSAPPSTLTQENQENPAEDPDNIYFSDYTEAPDNDLGSFENTILNYHNALRQANGLQPLRWGKAEAQKAADWATYLKTNEQCVIRHPINTSEERDKYIPNFMGQNLYAGFGYPDNPASAKSAISSWFSECSDYKPPSEGEDIPTNFEKVGHFTQLLWKDATIVGCAEIQCPKEMRDNNNVLVQTKGAIIACNYDKGNVGGQFNNMVPNPPKCDAGSLVK
jgi:hypothetical protein